MTHFVDLDIAFSDGSSAADSVRDLTHDLPGITTELLDPEGPGGGWPVYRFKGEFTDVRSVARRYYTEPPEHPQGPGKMQESRAFVDSLIQELS